MKRKNYLARLCRAARWRLPPEEAAEMISDYTELTAGRSDEELILDFGKPKDAVDKVRILYAPRELNSWRIVFGVLCFLLLLFYKQMMIAIPHLVIPYADIYLLFLPAVILPNVWFLWKRKKHNLKSQPFPRALPVCIGFILITMIVFTFYTYHVFNNYPILEIQTDSSSILSTFSPIIKNSILFIEIFVYIALAVAFYALIKARMYDRRWRALYILCISAVAFFLIYYFFLYYHFFGHANYQVDISQAVFYQFLFAESPAVLIGIISTYIALI